MTKDEQKQSVKNGYEEDSSPASIEAASGFDQATAAPVRTPLGTMVLSMFEKGQYVWVRVGAAHNATELYEHAFESADEANSALLDAKILAKDQVPDLTKLAGTGIQLDYVSAEQLEEAGLKRHLSSNL